MPESLSPLPILDASEAYRGSFSDLEEGVTVDGAEISRQRSALAAALAEQGLQPGDRLVFAVGNGPRFALAFAAVLEAGAAPVLVHAETPLEELRRIAGQYAASWALSDRPGSPGDGAQALHAPAPWASFRQLQMPPSPAGVEYPRLRGVPLHPTSGTTGVPKIAVRPGAAAIAEARHYVEAIGIDARDRMLCVAPMSHAYAFGTSAMVPLVSQASVVSMRAFNPKLVDRALEEQQLTLLFAVPAMLDILAHRRAPIRCHPGLRVFSAGAPLPLEVAERFERAYGVAPRRLYGTTETGGIAISTPHSARAEVGPAMRGVAVGLKLLEAEAGAKAGLGRLWVRSASMMAGYLASSGIDASALADGAFDTGDLASIDPATGSITLHGRQSDVINVFGMKVIPSEVEAVLRRLANVSDVIVYAGQHRSGSQIVQAAVVPQGMELDVSALRAHCEEHLAPYKRPQRIHLLERLPRTPSGKVIRAELP